MIILGIILLILGLLLPALGVGGAIAHLLVIGRSRPVFGRKHYF